MLLVIAQAGYAEQSQVPQGYYDSASQLSGKSLKVALQKVIQEHEVFDYGSLWYHYELTDVVPGTDNQVFDYYSPRVYYFTGTGTAPSGANKEHCCPQSWWGSGAVSNCYSDLFNVYPSDIDANSAKSNYPLGLVGSSVKFDNGCTLVGQSKRAEYDGMVFEPCDDYKGDFARIYFYVATCYANAPWGANPNVAKTVAFTQQDYPTIKSWLLDLLLQWNAADPVSDWEIIRNERVYSEQKNRNPFIDYPQLADYIWGDSVEYKFDFANALVNGSASGGTSGGHHEGGDPVDPNPGGGEVDPTDTTIAEMLLDEDFSSITDGNDDSSGGSGVVWAGNDNFPTVASTFQAGGAIRMGTSKKTGQITSRPLGNDEGATLTIEVGVKGWTSVEGSLIVGITGQEGLQVDYEATMSDSYETHIITLYNCPADATITIATTDRRCFLSFVRIGIAGDNSRKALRFDGRKKGRRIFTLSGKPVSDSFRGIAVEEGQVFFQGF